MQKDFITVTPDSGNDTATVTVAAAQNTGDARNFSIVISGGGMTRTIKVSQVKGKTPVSIYIRLGASQNPQQYWEWEDRDTNQSGREKFDSPIVIQNILGLSIQPNCDDCQITMIMGTSGDSDYVTGISGDFAGVEFNKFWWDIRDVEKRGEIEVSGEIIPLQIAERL